MLYRPFGHYSQRHPSLSRVFSEQFPSGEDRTAQNISTRHRPLCVYVIFTSFWNAHDKWCSEDKSFHYIWQWRVFKKKKKGNNCSLCWSFWRSHLHCSSVLFWRLRRSQWVWADLKNNEVDVLFYRLNNEVVCFREQPPHPPPRLPPPPPSRLSFSHKDTIPPLYRLFDGADICISNTFMRCQASAA